MPYPTKKLPKRAKRPHTRKEPHTAYLVTECPRCRSVRPHQMITKNGAWDGEGPYANWSTRYTLQCSCGKMWTHTSTGVGRDG